MRGIPVDGHWASCQMRLKQHCRCNEKGYGLLFVIAIVGSVVELGSGWEALSFSLIGDGVHMLSDGFVYGLAFFGYWTQRSSQVRGARSFKHYERYMRSLIFVIGVALVMNSLIQIIWFRSDIERSFDAALALTIGGLGTLMNIWMILILRGLSQERDGRASKSWLHRGAMLHTIGDFSGSVAVVITTGGVLLFHWPAYLDRIVAFAIGVWLVFQALRGEHVHTHHGAHQHHDKET